MRQVEVTAADHLMAIDQHHIEFRQPAGRTGNPIEGIDVQDEDAELTLHHLGQSRGRHIAELEFRGEALARFHGVLEARAFVQAERAAQQRRLPPDLRGDGAERSDPAPGVALIGAEALWPDISVAP